MHQKMCVNNFTCMSTNPCLCKTVFGVNIQSSQKFQFFLIFLKYFSQLFLRQHTNFHQSSCETFCWVSLSDIVFIITCPACWWYFFISTPCVLQQPIFVSWIIISPSSASIKHTNYIKRINQAHIKCTSPSAHHQAHIMNRTSAHIIKRTSSCTSWSAHHHEPIIMRPSSCAHH